MSECLITGCALVMDGRSVWGDLHKEGTAFIFNACLTPQRRLEEDMEMENTPGEARWQSSLPPPLIKTITFVGRYAAPFERRGVIVMHERDCELNPAAKDYIK